MRLKTGVAGAIVCAPSYLEGGACIGGPGATTMGAHLVDFPRDGPQKRGGFARDSFSDYRIEANFTAKCTGFSMGILHGFSRTSFASSLPPREA